MLISKTVRPDELSPPVDDGSPHEDNSQPENDGEGTQPQKTKTGKNIKKNLGKGKKKSSNQKTDVAQSLEANGPLDKNKVTESSPNSEQEHIGQGDAPVTN